MKRKHLVSKQDCYNKRKKLSSNTSRHADDAISVNILINELQNEDYNPIVIYKPQGAPDPDIYDTLYLQIYEVKQAREVEEWFSRAM